MTELLRLSPGPGETPPDFGSRLAAKACRDDFRAFCVDFGLDAQGIVDGRPEAVSDLATLSGCDASALLGATFARVGQTTKFRYRGQLFARYSLTRHRVRACPACLSHDMREGSGRPQARPFRRGYWTVRCLRTCIVHQATLVELDPEPNRGVLDCSRALASAIPRLGLLARRSEPREPSPFERYVMNRIEGKAAGSWLDGLPLYAATQLCLVMGAVSVHGPKVTMDHLDDAQAWRSEAVGFAVADAGPPGIRSLLDRLQRPFRQARSEPGPKVMYGRLYDWLAHECGDPSYDPVRDVILDHALNTLAFGPGDVLFGRTMTERRTHSVHSASREFGLHPKRMRRLLRREGITEADDGSVVNSRVVFRPADAESFLGDLTQCVSLEKLRPYLSVPRPHDRGLLERGLVKPMIVGERYGIAHAFKRSDLDAFLATLLRHADPALACGAGMMGMIPAARRSCAHVMDVVQLVLDRRLQRVGSDPGKSGFVSVLVDAAEVRPLVTEPAYEGHSLEQVETLLRTRTAVAKNLVATGLLGHRVVKNPVTGWIQRIVANEDLESFRHMYATLHQVSRETEEHFIRTKKRLAAAGVTPVLDPDVLGVTLYRRSDLA